MEGPMEEDVEEADVEMDVGEVPPTGDLAPGQARALLATMLAMAGIWTVVKMTRWLGWASAQGPGVYACWTGGLAAPGQNG